MYTRSVTERGLPSGTDRDLMNICFEALASSGPFRRLAVAWRRLIGVRGQVETRLAKGQMLSVCGFDKVMVSSRGGRAVVTAEGWERDRIVRSGRSTVVRGPGRVVVTAEDEGVRVCVSGH